MSDVWDEKRGCEVCGPVFERDHKLSERHQFNHMMYGFNKCRKAMAKDKFGVTIEASIVNTLSSGRKLEFYEQVTKKGEYICVISEDEMRKLGGTISYNFTITAEYAVHLMNCDKLHPLSYFDFKRLEYIPFEDGESKTDIMLTLTNGFDVGVYKMTVHFNFQTIETKKKAAEPFCITRDMVVHVCDNVENFSLKEAKMESPFTNKEWLANYITVPSLCNRKITQDYPIKETHLQVFKFGLKSFNEMTENEDRIRKYISERLDQKLSRETYKDYFHYLLWLDEAGAIVLIRKYNMENVYLKLTDNYFVELTVPGLAEKRPSVIKGDTISIKECGGNIVYQGIVKNIFETYITISDLSKQLIKLIKIPNKFFDVRFDISRLAYERMHRAVDLCVRENQWNVLFPEFRNNFPNLHRPFKLNSSDFRNPYVKRNEEQKEAVLNILNRSSSEAPYIVFGPPGTGKTITIVEAIYQVLNFIPTAKILVCAPANAACDMLVLKLSEYFTKDEMIRIHSHTTEWEIIPEVVKNYSNRTSKNRSKNLNNIDLSTYKIVVTTPVSAGRFAEKYKASHVFIDEAAQAEEPQVLIAIGGIMQNGGQLVLAGDPKQLKPVCSSIEASKRGLGISMLERLMQLPLYNNKNNMSKYFMTKLIINYRNHPQILKLPNELFYDGDLVAVSPYPLEDRINKIYLPINNYKNMIPNAIEFFGISSDEEKEGMTPSYFNRREISIVLKYVAALTNPHIEDRVEQNEIGIITPYIRQVYRIRRALGDALKSDVEVGTAETFQGREKRVIIISTVRAKASLLLYDQKYNIGFVNCSERFNVALTRAKSKLIIVGNPQCLHYDDNWSALINYCRDLRSYRGFYVEKRDSRVRADIKKRIDSNRQLAIIHNTNNNNVKGNRKR